MSIPIIAQSDQAMRAQALAVAYGLTYVTTVPDVPFWLVLTARHLALHCHDPAMTPLVIDFKQGKARHRSDVSQAYGHPLVKAVGVKPNYCPSIIDTTAGMGDDAYLLASLGCNVLMLERHPVIAALLQDALLRLSQPEIELSLHHGDAADYLANLAEPVDVIVLDPMFPAGKQRAKVKKGMQILQQLVGHDLDPDMVLHAALNKATKKVVVKRPNHARPLGNLKPSHTINTKHHRFDVYPCA